MPPCRWSQVVTSLYQLYVTVWMADNLLPAPNQPVSIVDRQNRVQHRVQYTRSTSGAMYLSTGWREVTRALNIQVGERQ